MGCCERPLITSCWCCGLRGGSIAAAIYALVYSAFSIAFQSWTISNRDQYTEGDHEIVSQNEYLFITTCVDIGLYLILFIGSILVLIGTTNLNRCMLIVFLVVMGLLVILQGIGCVLYLVILLQEPNPYVVVLMMIAVFFTCVDFMSQWFLRWFLGWSPKETSHEPLTEDVLMCELCVFSFYQELRLEAPSHLRAMYKTRVPSQGPISEKNTEVSFTSLAGSGQDSGHQPVAFISSQGQMTTTKPTNDEAPPPYVA